MKKEKLQHSLYLPDSSILKKWYEDYCNSYDEYQLNYFDQYEIEHNNPHFIQMRKFLEKYRKDDFDEIL
ncbi:MAG: hypothetical protein SPE03_13025 [Treponema sp.]|nr:hypothetical protein [Treponema sp.]